MLQLSGPAAGERGGATLLRDWAVCRDLAGVLGSEGRAGRAGAGGWVGQQAVLRARPGESHTPCLQLGHPLANPRQSRVSSEGGGPGLE